MFFFFGTKPTIIVSVLSGVIEIKTKGDFSKQIRIWKKIYLKLKLKQKEIIYTRVNFIYCPHKRFVVYSIFCWTKLSWLRYTSEYIEWRFHTNATDKQKWESFVYVSIRCVLFTWYWRIFWAHHFELLWKSHLNVNWRIQLVCFCIIFFFDFA